MKHNEEYEKNKRVLDKTITYAPWFALGALVVIVVIYFVVRIGLTPTRDPAVWGAFGDFLGGTLNPILSLITIVLLVNSIRIQNYELGEASQQMKLTREVHQQSLIFNRIYDSWESKYDSIVNPEESKIQFSYIKDNRTYQFESNLIAFPVDTLEQTNRLMNHYPEFRLLVVSKCFALEQKIADMITQTNELRLMGATDSLLRPKLQGLKTTLDKFRQFLDGVELGEEIEHLELKFHDMIVKNSIDIAAVE